MRRILLPVVAGLLLCAPAAAAAPRATDFSVRLGDAGPASATGPAAHAAGRAWTSPVIRTRRRFAVVGLLWRHAPAHLHVRVRVREDGRWRRWTEVPAAHSARSTDPVWAGGAGAVQVRLSRRVRGLRLHFVSVRRPVRRPRVVARAAAAMPAIVPREQWGAQSCAPRDAPTMGEVQMGFVHHTVSANDYGPEDSAAMVLAICRFHRNGNGWDDIGYNFLVDKYGTIFEGRAGGVDQPVVGAQAQGFNSVSTGVANLGTYSDVPQSDAAIDAMARLLAWKLPLHGAPVTGTVTVASAGGDTNRYPKGTPVTFERISGHRDANQTECPGEQLYAQLPVLRQRASQQAPPIVPVGGTGGGAPKRLTLQAARRALAFPEPAQLTGRLTDAAGTGVAGTTVRLQVLTPRGFRAVASVVTAPDGTWAGSLPTSRNRVVRALVGKVASNRVRVTVAPVLTVPAPARRVRAGRRAVLRGEVRPHKAALVVQVARQADPSLPARYTPAFTVRGRAAGGRFRLAVPLRRPGLYRLRVRFAGDRRNTPAQVDHYVRAVRGSVSRSAGGSAAPAGR